MKFRDVTPMDILEMLERRIENESLSQEDKLNVQSEIDGLRLSLKEIYNNDFDERLRELWGLLLYS